MFDYKLKIEMADGSIRENYYQNVITVLKMADEIVMGAPLSEGGTPQVMIFINQLKKILKAKSISAFYQGNELLKV